DHEQLARAIRVQSTRLLHALIHVGLMTPQHLAEDAAVGGAPCADQRSEAAQNSGVRAEELLDAARAAGLLRRARHPADDRRQRGVHRLLGLGRIDAELLADLLNLLWPEMRLAQIEC